MGRKLSEPSQILNFDFFRSYNDSESALSGNEDDENAAPDSTTYAFGESCFETDIVATADGVVDALLLWWETSLLSRNLDPANSCCYSTEPDVQNFQDHWQQTVFPLPSPIKVQVCKTQKHSP